MNNRDAELPQSKDERESSWVWLGKAWVVGYLLPGLIGLAFTLHYQAEKNAEEDKRRQERLNKQVEAINEELNDRVLEGKATETELILLGIDREEYEEYKQRRRRVSTEDERK